MKPRPADLAVLLSALAFVAGCAAPDRPAERTAAIPGSSAWFVDATEQSGIDFEHVRAVETRYWLPEIMSGGAAWCDHDADGDLDLYLVQGGELQPGSAERPANRLYRNDGDGRFADVTEQAGVGDTGYGMGAACGDYDADGDLDLYVTNVGPNVLYRNDGSGRFTDVTAGSGTGDPSWSSSAVFVDFDLDRDLDLFVVNYVNWSPRREVVCSSGAHTRDYCQPENYDAPAPDKLYRNDGEEGFSEVSGRAGIRAAFGNGLGVAVSDFDGDGRPDLYVTNDGNPNQLWINDGNGRFRNEALVSGTAVNMTGQTEAGMGVVAEDVDCNGHVDLFMTHLRGETNTFYLNHGGWFEDVTAMIGLAAPSFGFTGFGTGFADFDHDGRLDLFIANGRVGRSLAPLVEHDPFAEPNQLFRGLDAGRFEEVAPGAGVPAGSIGNSRAAAFGDYDNDGDVDVAVLDNGGRMQLLRNDAGTRGSWVMFRVVEPPGVDALGTRVRIHTGGVTRCREVRTAYGYCAAHDPRVHFGLGESKQIDAVELIWQDGSREWYGPVAANEIHVLRRGAGRGARSTGDRP